MEDYPFDEEWDAGDTRCRDLVGELGARLEGMEAREVLRLRATDDRALEEIPDWCNQTKNPLMRARPPYYWIARKE